jgi:hypothetical protein
MSKNKKGKASFRDRLIESTSIALASKTAIILQREALEHAKIFNPEKSNVADKMIDELKFAQQKVLGVDRLMSLASYPVKIQRAIANIHAKSAEITLQMNEVSYRHGAFFAYIQKYGDKYYEVFRNFVNNEAEKGEHGAFSKMLEHTKDFYKIVNETSKRISTQYDLVLKIAEEMQSLMDEIISYSATRGAEAHAARQDDMAKIVAIVTRFKEKYEEKKSIMDEWDGRYIFPGRLPEDLAEKYQEYCRWSKEYHGASTALQPISGESGGEVSASASSVTEGIEEDEREAEGMWTGRVLAETAAALSASLSK